MNLDALKFDTQGLIPAVVQEAETGEVLMVAWVDRAALEATLTTGQAHFWSRSRQTLWRKGETSGNTFHVQNLFADCDGDTLLVQVHLDGVACHTGRRTCFFTEVMTDRTGDYAAANMLERLERIVETRRSAAPPGSYVAALLGGGEAAVCRKVGEEAIEVITAILGGESRQRVVEEMADLWFHSLILLGARGIPLREVLEELARRHAKDGGRPG